MEQATGRLLARIVRSRLRAWIVAIGALIIAMMISAASMHASDEVLVNDLSSSSESARAARHVERAVASRYWSAVVVFSGTKSDFSAAVGKLSAKAESLVTVYSDDSTQASRGPLLVPSKDGKAGLVFISLDAKDDPAKKIREMRDDLTKLPKGIRGQVTGGPAVSADVSAVFDGADFTLLIGTTILVLVLLVLIYRSPIFWLIPLITVVLAESAVRGLGVMFADAGLKVDPATGGITSVLVFGAGTDYALLLVARYRDELRHTIDRFEAMRRALTAAGPTIVASGISVAICLLGLLLARTPSLAVIGIMSAVGVLVAMLLTLTLLPALLMIVGRGVFWPFIPHVADEPHEPGTSGFWRSVGNRVARKPRIAWIIASVVLAACALGVPSLPGTLSPAEQFIGKVEAITAQQELAQHFDSGTSSPTRIFLPGGTLVDANEVAETLNRSSSIVTAVAVTKVARPGAVLDATLSVSPYDQAAIDAIPRIRSIVHREYPKSLVGGEAAQEYDKQRAAHRDVLIVVPVVLVAELLLLMGLLRCIVTPLMLIGSVILSYGAALGIGALAFTNIFDFGGADPTLPLLAFVFLTALGVDYNIFLMARAREETLERGTREGMLRSLGATGSVITSAGIVLAGTFAILGVLPILQLAQIGFIIAVGVFIDTFIVRSILVPAAVLDLGPRAWLPSTLARKDASR